jgi:hypothetical protein
MTTALSLRGFMPLAVLTVSACGSSNDNTSQNTFPDGGISQADGGTTTENDGGATTDGGGASDQTPPTSGASVEAWLKTGVYKDWHCEDDVHEARPPSPHGYTRICSNDAIADNANGSGAWPRGAAAVKEMYEDEDSKDPGGYAVYLKTADDSAGGANWYWYGLVSLDSKDTEADGMGDTGTARSLCVSCHVTARDFVFTPVD